MIIRILYFLTEYAYSNGNGHRFQSMVDGIIRKMQNISIGNYATYSKTFNRTNIVFSAPSMVDPVHTIFTHPNEGIVGNHLSEFEKSVHPLSKMKKRLDQLSDTFYQGETNEDMPVLC